MAQTFGQERDHFRTFLFRANQEEKEKCQETTTNDYHGVFHHYKAPQRPVFTDSEFMWRIRTINAEHYELSSLYPLQYVFLIHAMVTQLGCKSSPLKRPVMFRIIVSTRKNFEGTNWANCFTQLGYVSICRDTITTCSAGHTILIFN